jgi:hypothetical protein
MTGIRQLDQVERGIEEALRNFTGNGANGGGEMPDITADDRIDKIGNVSAAAIIEASETAPGTLRPPHKPRKKSAISRMLGDIRAPSRMR